MKLKNDFIIQSVCDIQMALSQEYTGILRLNETSRFIIEMLAQETTEAALLDALCARYDAPKEVLQADLSEILSQLREADLLIE